MRLSLVRIVSHSKEGVYATLLDSGEQGFIQTSSRKRYPIGKIEIARVLSEDPVLLSTRNIFLEDLVSFQNTFHKSLFYSTIDLVLYDQKSIREAVVSAVNLSASIKVSPFRLTIGANSLSLLQFVCQTILKKISERGGEGTIL